MGALRGRRGRDRRRVARAAALAAVALAAAGCARERPSPTSVANCLERHGATVHSGDLDPVGFDEDVTGLRFVSATDHRRANSILDVLDLYGGGLFLFARSDPDAVRLQQDPAFGGEEAPFRRSGSVLYIAPERVASACL